LIVETLVLAAIGLEVKSVTLRTPGILQRGIKAKAAFSHGNSAHGCLLIEKK